MNLNTERDEVSTSNHIGDTYNQVTLLKRTLKSEKKQKLLIFIIGLFFLVFRVIYMMNINVLIDDAFISFRFARNFSEGLGLVFNSGERVEGYTNFLWTVLLSGCIKLGFDVSISSVILAFMCAAGSLLILISTIYKLIFIKNKWAMAIIASLIFSLMGSQSRYILSGMETLLFMFLLNLSIYTSYFYNKDYLSGFLFGLTVMCRPEGLIYFGFVLFVFVVFKKKGINGVSKFLLGFLMLFLPYFIWRFTYYGYIFPNTYYAKASGFSFQRIIRGFTELNWLINNWFFWPLLLLMVGSFPLLLKNRTVLFFFALFAINILSFVYVGGDFVIWFGPRFLMPVLPTNIILALIGLWYFSGKLSLSMNSSISINLIAGIMVVFLLLQNSWPAFGDKLLYFTHQMRAWRELSVWMRNELPANTTLATDAVGIVPFYTNFYTIDMFGLIDEYIAHLPVDTGIGTIAHEKYDPKYILSRKPDCIFSSWINEKGEPQSAGLSNSVDAVLADYSLIVVTNTRYTNDETPWLIVNPDYSPQTYGSGYISGLYCRKDFIQNLHRK